MDRAALDRDVQMIKQIFAEVQRAKASVFVEEQKKAVLESIFQDIDSRDSRRIYLNDEVKNLVDGRFRIAQNKNAELVSKLKEARTMALQNIQQTAQKFEKLRETHLENNDKEFRFKLNGDPNLLKYTLSTALPHLAQKNKKLEEQLAQFRYKSGYEVEALEKEVGALENELRLLSSM